MSKAMTASTVRTKVLVMVPDQPPITAAFLEPFRGTGLKCLIAKMPTVDLSGMDRAQANSLTADELYPGRAAIRDLLDGAFVGISLPTRSAEDPTVATQFGIPFAFGP
jgi:hypothetical protein